MLIRRTSTGGLEVEAAASEATTVVPTAVPPITGWRKVVLPAFVACVRASLRVSPRPMAFLIRRQFARARALTQAEVQDNMNTPIVP